MTHTKNWLNSISLHFRIALIGIVWLCSYGTGYAQNDTIILKNKDRLIGEIKEMDRGVLIIETDYSDSDFKLKWIDIKKLSSDQTFLITLKEGNRINSKLQMDSINGGRVVLHDIITKDYIYTTIDDIVYVKSVKQGFISRLDASLSIGLNLTQSNNFKQLSVRSTLGYTANYWSIAGSYNAIKTRQDESEDINRTDASLGIKYFFNHDYFINVSSEILSNNEQQLKLRVTTKAGVGKYFVHTNRVYFGSAVGLAWNNERYEEALGTNRNSAEAFVGMELNMFDFKDFSLLTNAVVYPSLTESRRVRSDIKLDVKYDLPLDFFIKMGATYNYDKRPPEGANKEDYVFQATFGWEL
ncbi:DUF481 domain-containing protein [Flavobacterium beibuense]|uniref:Salt-induced outer membrane protein n=1 Tax=Flavobacterium beibuense TaxID=657326 RepID=A0A444WAK1_9FLAO|nr:DUF481 domain-containing protein [Flavobacterium beibuense]RYJ42766.1 salt-induced outer membrane protein [Flavobacterium beibuense]